MIKEIPHYPYVKFKFDMVVRYDTEKGMFKTYKVKKGDIMEIIWKGAFDDPYDIIIAPAETGYPYPLSIRCDWDMVDFLTDDEAMVEML